ncbi:MAG TPA: hypothetical protein VLA43_00845, partial [Longimicrobiales bacterium]|nr:hypothetical protein [Longimicrobiales bacterium]
MRTFMVFPPVYNDTGLIEARVRVSGTSSPGLKTQGDIRMIGRLKQGVIGVAAALTLALAIGPSAAHGQDMGRYRVLVPDLFPAQGTKKDFGEDLAKEL